MSHMLHQVKNLSHFNVMNTLGYATEAFPGLRVGQIIDNALLAYQDNHPEADQGELFYTSDDMLIAALKEYIERFGD